MDGDIVIDALKGEEHIIQPCSYLREGYVFKWWVDQDGNILNPGDKIIPLKETFLSAEWDDGQYFIDSDISGVGNITKIPDKEFYSYNEAVTVKAVPGEHYEFIEWKHSSEISDTLELIMTRNVTVYPVFEKVKFTVIFKNGDDIVSTQTIGYGEDAVLPETPTREGWTFDSWKIVDNELIDEPWKNIQNDVIINARFKREIEQKRTYVSPWCSGINNVKVLKDESITVHTNEKSGYITIRDNRTGITTTVLQQIIIAINNQLVSTWTNNTGSDTVVRVQVYKQIKGVGTSPVTYQYTTAVMTQTTEYSY